MSDLFDEEPDEPTSRRPGRRARALVITGGILLVGFFALTAFAAVYTDRLWYQEVGYSQVFSTMLWTRVGLFLVFGVFMGAAVAVNMHLAYRFRPLFRMPGADTSVDRYRDAVTPIRTWLLIGVAVVVGGFAGTSAVGQWRTYLLWRNGQPWGEDDAYFGRDLGFFVFDLPWWHYVVDFVMAAAVVAVIATAVVHYLYGGIRLQVQHDRLSGAAQVQFSVLLGIFVLAKAVDYYLGRFDLVTEDHDLFTGMNYTGENALLPARNILLGVAVICAILFFLNVWRRTWQLPSIGLALLALSAVLLGMIWPAIVQNFQVQPSEADKESPYIQRNIEATRAAYGIADVEPEPYQGIPDGEGDAGALQTQLTQVPLVDPKQVFQTFEQRQQPRVYYSVSPVLDVDRYELDGEEQPLVLGVREVDVSELNDSDQNWNNLHTVYTHGEGLIAAYADRVSPNEANGRMVWAEGIEEAENVFSSQDIESRIYYGERSPSYSVVGKAGEDSPDVELGLELGTDPEEDAKSDSQTTYDGEGGVPIGSSFRQLMYAIKFGEPNFVLAERVNSNSKVLYNREPIERVEAVAPWLTVDGDPYPAVIDGRIQWILDGYTTTDRYPNSDRESFEEMIDDSLQEETGFQTIPTDEINYMRSAVKATVDAYDGSVTLYEWDEEDPILQTWMSAFPDTVQPKDTIPESLQEHLRYPEDLFKAQRYQLAKYHVTDPGDFYSGTERWEVPTDPQSQGNLQPPYRFFSGTDPEAAAAGDDWSLTSVFVPRGRGNLASFFSVNSDATSENFGQLRLLQMTDQNAPGPGIAANEMQQDDGVRDALRDFIVADTPPIFGNLLTVPINDGLIYVQPVYAVRSGAASSFPILQFVIVRHGSDVGIGRDLVTALSDALGVDPPDDTNNGGGGNDNPPEGPPQSLDERIEALLRDAQEAFTAAEEVRGTDLQEWAALIEKAERLIAQAVALADERDAAGSGDDEATDQPNDEPTEESTEPTDGETGE